MRILIVDDNASMRILLSTLLADRGHQIVGSLAEGNGVMEAVDRLTPDIVCLDYQLPGRDGLDILDEINSARPEIDVLFMTASEEPEIERKAADAGAAGFLRKPFGQKQVIDEIQDVVATRLGLDDADVLAACAEASQGDVVSAVNFNAPGQVVIAGSAAAVERAIEACKAKGAKRAMALPVSVPSHCDLMRPAAERFAASVEAIAWQAPQIPLVQNVSAAVVADLDALKRDLLAQLYSPVRWVESMVALGERGVTSLVECGPGKVLSGLNKRCVKGINTYNLDTPEAFAAARAALA